MITATEIREVAREVRYARDDVLRAERLGAQHRIHALRSAHSRLTELGKKLDRLQREVFDE